MKNQYTRRQWLTSSTAVGSGIVLMPALLLACGKKSGGASEALDCSSTAGLAPMEVATRNALKYVELSTDPQKNCANCALYVVPPQEGVCAGCQVIKGPINPKGNCTSWAPKPEATTGQAG